MDAAAQVMGPLGAAADVRSRAYRPQDIRMTLHSIANPHPFMPILPLGVSRSWLVDCTYLKLQGMGRAKGATVSAPSDVQGWQCSMARMQGSMAHPGLSIDCTAPQSWDQ